MEIGNVPSLFPSNYTMNNFTMPQSNSIFRSIGVLTWLSGKAGLITCSKPVPNTTVSFQLKDFCDQGVSDLTSVLRVGFMLAFQATASEARANEWIAVSVTPISDQDLAKGVASDGKELDLDSFEQSGTRQMNKDSYSTEKEMQAISFLLNIYLKNNTHFIPLSSLHSRISNSQQEELYRYIGSSSLKRRNFIEDRSYIFQISENDVVSLQPPEIYTTVCLLSGFLLTHGGVTSSDALFSFFINCGSIPMAMKDFIQNQRKSFMQFLSRHPFAFSPFPSQYYVSVRRNLPYFDYSLFIKKHFPACIFPRSVVHGLAPTRPSHQPFGSAFESLADSGANGLYHPQVPTPLASAGIASLFQDLLDDSLIGNQMSHQLNGPSSGRMITGGGGSGGGLGSGATNGSIWAPNDMDFFDHTAGFTGLVNELSRTNIGGGGSSTRGSSVSGVGNLQQLASVTPHAVGIGAGLMNGYHDDMASKFGGPPKLNGLINNATTNTSPAFYYPPLSPVKVKKVDQATQTLLFPPLVSSFDAPVQTKMVDQGTQWTLDDLDGIGAKMDQNNVNGGDANGTAADGTCNGRAEH